MKKLSDEQALKLELFGEALAEDMKRQLKELYLLDGISHTYLSIAVVKQTRNVEDNGWDYDKLYVYTGHGLNFDAE